MSPRLYAIICIYSAASLYAQDPLPIKGPADRLDFEPKLMLDGPNAPKLSGTADISPDDRVAKCQADLTYAEQRAADAEQLFKDGILAKVEAEARYLRVLQARKELADAHSIAATAHQQAVEKSFAAHTASQSDIDSANAAVKTTGTAAAAADTDWSKAELNAALLDLQRKRKLYKEGVGSQHDVQMAEDRAALLTGTYGAATP